MSNSATWDTRFMAMADLAASWSKDPSTRVGAVIAQGKHAVGHGFNGLPAGVADTPERLNDRATKYQMVLHAEVNAVLDAGRDARGAACYVTHPPCSACTAVLIQAGIARIVTRRPDAGLAERFADSFRLSAEMLAEVGIPLAYLGG